MKKEDISLKDKIKHTLEETRVVLPGTQAFLGFQLVGVFSQGFDKLSTIDKYFHLLSLILVLMSTISLMAIASYHRIAESGQDTEALHQFGSKMLITGMILLLLGISVEFFLISELITRSSTVAYFTTGFILIVAILLWYLIPFWKKR